MKRWPRIALLLGPALAGCSPGGPADAPRGSPPASPSPPALAAGAGGGQFRDVAGELGIRFQHRHGGKGDKNFIETMGGGAALFDLEGDGDLDAFLVQSGALPGDPVGEEGKSRLFRNDGGRFLDVTEAAGADNNGSYGQGAVAADYDNDGLIDLYVTNFGPNRLYHNEGGGRFRDVTMAAGVGNPLWSVSGAFGDFNRDGLLDLYVANYVDFTMDNNKWCGRKGEGLRAYCHPDQYNGVPPSLYVNNGDGTFTDRAAENGVKDTQGKGLGVVATDLDLDGHLDLFGANDSTINYFWRNKGDGSFENLTLASGLGYSEDGKVQACMGVDSGDFNRDGRFDIVVTNLDLEYNTLYQNQGGLIFVDVSYRTGVASARLREVGFGTEMFDFDLDGWLDILVVNGHVIDNIVRTNDALTYAQPKTLLRNLGNGHFEEVSEGMPDLVRKHVSRGAAFGDIDQDGDVDVLVGNNNEPAELLRNDGLARGGFLVVCTEGRESNRQGIGSLLTLETPGLKQLEEVRAGTSYGSSSDPCVTFGLGASPAATGLDLRWPGGRVERVPGPLAAGSWIRLVEGEGKPRISSTRAGLFGG